MSSIRIRAGYLPATSLFLSVWFQTHTNSGTHTHTGLAVYTTPRLSPSLVPMLGHDPRWGRTYPIESTAGLVTAPSRCQPVPMMCPAVASGWIPHQFWVCCPKIVHIQSELETNLLSTCASTLQLVSTNTDYGLSERRRMHGLHGTCSKAREETIQKVQATSTLSP